MPVLSCVHSNNFGFAESSIGAGTRKRSLVGPIFTSLALDLLYSSMAVFGMHVHAVGTFRKAISSTGKARSVEIAAGICKQGAGFGGGGI